MSASDIALGQSPISIINGYLVGQNSTTLMQIQDLFKRHMQQDVYFTVVFCLDVDSFLHHRCATQTVSAIL